VPTYQIKYLIIFVDMRLQQFYTCMRAHRVQNVTTLYKTI